MWRILRISKTKKRGGLFPLKLGGAGKEGLFPPLPISKGKALGTRLHYNIIIRFLSLNGETSQKATQT